MKTNRTVLTVAIATAMALSLSACSNSGSSDQTPSPAPAATAPAPAATAAAPSAASTAAAPASGSTAAASASGSMAQMVAGNQQAGDNWFGGPVYNGQPDLAATAALVQAGGGADNFDFSKALVAMLGEKTVNAEVAKLTQQYGKQNVDDFVNGMTFAVKDALKRATEQGIKLPAPTDAKGAKLAGALVDAGTAPDGTFWSGYLFDHALSHALHNEVMADIDAKDGQAADGNVHKVLNQAMYDVAQALGKKNVKLASFH